MFSVLLLLLLSCCARVAITPPSPPLDHQAITGIISAFKKQGAMVRTLVSSGTLTLDIKGSESDTNVLIVATRDPSKIKMEITHTWGRPLLHILINGSSLDILSFTDKRLYSGQLGHLGLSRLIPVPLSPELVWTLARAYPVLLNHNRALSVNGNQIALLDQKEDKIQVVDLYPETDLPHRVFFSQQNAEVIFSDFQNSDGIRYAKEMELNSPDDNARLALEIRQITFNKPVPEAIFRLETPLDFELVPLKSVNCED
ncbi:MAG: DUF4292 domain-containing protein [Deltaproteobacteria bacterium]|nr:DUF4292 domain-containing protein [Deltaproteobacteria bacterium]